MTTTMDLITKQLRRTKRRPAFPIELVRLEGRPVLVAGAGSAAAGKIEALIETGAHVHVIAPEITEAVARFFPRLFRVEKRPVRPADVIGKHIVIAATGDRATNRELALLARAHGALVNAVDDPESCDFYVPAIVRRGPVRFAIGTSGGSPLFASQLRRLMEAVIPASVGSIGALFVRLRRRGLRGLGSRGRVLRALTDGALNRMIDRGLFSSAEQRLETILDDEEEPFPRGTVCIAGAGPGAKELLTLRARDRIERADVIFHDALVEDEVLALAMPDTRLISAGKRCGDGVPRAAAETNAQMIEEAHAGRRVLRLHGGDPFVFGRGGEELEALENAGIHVELVPGVSAVLACAHAARVPLTQRRVSRGICVRTGHTAEGPTRAEVARGEETVVVLMGLGSLDAIAKGLVEEGKSPELPAVVVSRASTSCERVVVGTLETIAERVAAAAIEAPATLIAGPAVDVVRV